MAVAYKDGKIEEIADDEVDYELVEPTRQFGSHINAIPVQSAVQGPRLFYGARFYNQAMPLKHREAPLVQNLDETDPEGKSFDQILGRYAGAQYLDEEAEITDVTPDYIHYRNTAGEKKKKAIYNSQVFNRKSGITNFPRVKPGDKVTPGQVIASSNYTDDNGNLALGLNARVGVVPYKGYSMDDAIVISQKFADNFLSEHMETHVKEFDRDIKPGKDHFRSLFPQKFTKVQLENLDDKGVVKPGTVLNEGDPIILATRPRVISSTGANVGKLTKSMSQARGDASSVWESSYPAEVVDVFESKKGAKVITRAYAPTKEGDKIVFRSGQKSVVSKILPEERMPRTRDGEPLDVLLNPLSVPSRTNTSLLFELMLGKVAKKTGKPIVLPGFTKPGEKWNDIVKKYLDEAGVSDREDIYDPEEDKMLEHPVLVGNAYVMRLHHTAESKEDARGQGSYDAWQSPSKGSGPGGSSKRLSGLESTVMLSSGAYNNLREGSTLRGQANDEYWRALRMGLTPPKPGTPFAWEKTMNMLIGGGINPRKVGKGVLRLAPARDEDLEEKRPIEITKGELLNLNTLAPVNGGLFDPSLVGNNGWGKITLPHRYPNPAYEESVRTLLGLKKKDLQDILAGKMELPEYLR
jgi:DNA-directed RNA polymerase subunit beta